MGSFGVVGANAKYIFYEEGKNKNCIYSAEVQM
jgi:hypothetical protein